jgi:hypothetical protein
MAVGSEWDYKLTAGGRVQILTIKVTKHVMLNGVMCAQLETFRNGMSLAAEFLNVKGDGVYRLKTASFEAKPPVRILKLPVKNNDSWKIDSTTANQKIKGTYTLTQEKMKVPAGEYKNAAVIKSPNLSVGPMTWNYSAAYVKGVGLIYQKIVVGGRTLLIQELKEYRPAKKTK